MEYSPYFNPEIETMTTVKAIKRHCKPLYELRILP